MYENFDFHMTGTKGRQVARDKQVIFGLLGGTIALLIFMPVLLGSMLLWEAFFYIPYYGNVGFLKAVPLLWPLAIILGAYLGILCGKYAFQRLPGEWGYRIAAILGGLTGSTLFGILCAGLIVFLESNPFS